MGKSIEGIPVIIRFKTQGGLIGNIYDLGIEGIPVIIRFKTCKELKDAHIKVWGIEGIPVIIRFKTHNSHTNVFHQLHVLKVFQL